MWLGGEQANLKPSIQALKKLNLLRNKCVGLDLSVNNLPEAFVSLKERNMDGESAEFHDGLFYGHVLF